MRRPFSVLRAQYCSCNWKTIIMICLTGRGPLRIRTTQHISSSPKKEISREVTDSDHHLRHCECEGNDNHFRTVAPRQVPEIFGLLAVTCQKSCTAHARQDVTGPAQVGRRSRCPCSMCSLSVLLCQYVACFISKSPFLR